MLLQVVGVSLWQWQLYAITGCRCELIVSSHSWHLLWSSLGVEICSKIFWKFSWNVSKPHKQSLKKKVNEKCRKYNIFYLAVIYQDRIRTDLCTRQCVAIYYIKKLNIRKNYNEGIVKICTNSTVCSFYMQLQIR
jgi:hypothetical protein